jgi:two-component system response regulator (stage 0 sporulation protein F)
MTLVLIVDDVETMAEQYAYDLKRVGGYETRVATGGAEALEAVAGGVVDCMILDLEMPGIDGFEVLRRLRKQGFQTPVIVYTGTGDYDRCVKAIKLGAYARLGRRQPAGRIERGDAKVEGRDRAGRFGPEPGDDPGRERYRQRARGARTAPNRIRYP